MLNLPIQVHDNTLNEFTTLTVTNLDEKDLSKI